MGQEPLNQEPYSKYDFFMVDASLQWDGMKETEGSVRFKSEEKNACGVQIPHQPNRGLFTSLLRCERECAEVCRFTTMYVKIKLRLTSTVVKRD